MIDLGVVMPVYVQKPEFLQAALESVLNQSFSKFKMVIVIDGAPEMEPLVKSIVNGDQRVKIVAYPNNQGVAHALNTGFQHLFLDEHIEYLTWVSSDNVYYPYYLEMLRRELKKGSDELGLVYSSFQSIDNNGSRLHNEHQLAALRKYQSRPKERLLDSSIIGVSFMYKSKYAKMIDGYHLVPVEDYDYWLRLTENCEIRYIPVELMDYRVNSTYSVSATLKSSEQHRRWRYTYHLARHLARSRRKMKPQVTVLFPISIADEAALMRLENLYEQSFSNYYCYVLDLTTDQSAQVLLSKVPHPITDFKWYPTVNELVASLIAVQMIQTPYTMILNNVCTTDVVEMETLLIELSKAEPSAMSNYYTPDHSQIGYRFAPYLPQKLDYYNELFKTEQLVQAIKFKYMNAW
ncbi:glycosyl transferase [Paenibacillus sp. FSL H7-0326]|uniref:glycosyltransferase family 2 protein n=1 Tax=Paenibacillus sp. FSL H7-0326 TaxID=1921144 RepID=UPI00096CA1D3|nr:glycosyltransferase family 2 protein [Paenibacillus sp. FSL H7-0326]OMC70730.1 glycosyl transferase [Paenibacillus sp. FSL H7-0326]